MRIKSTPEGEQAVRIGNMEDAEERLMDLIETYTTEENKAYMHKAFNHLSEGLFWAYKAIQTPKVERYEARNRDNEQ